MTDAELFMKMRAAFRDAEAFVESAADRFEAQAAEIERLVREKGWIMEERDRTFALVLARAEMAEAKLAKAVENTLDAASAYMTEQYGISALSHPVDRARAIATLAELKGAKP